MDSPELIYLKEVISHNQQVLATLLTQLVELSALVNTLIGFEKSRLIDEGLSPEEAAARIDEIVQHHRIGAREFVSTTQREAQVFANVLYSQKGVV